MILFSSIRDPNKIIMNVYLPIIILLGLIIIVGIFSYILFFQRPVESYEVKTKIANPLSRKGVYFVTFGDGIYQEPALRFSQELQTLSYSTEVHCFTYSDIDPKFYEANKDILQQKRGSGYWLWKPYFCKGVWDKLSYGDVLVYLDGGLTLVDDLQPYIQRAVESESGGLAFEQWGRQDDFTKPEVFEAMGLPIETYGKRLQFWAAIMIVQKRKENENFFAEWLYYCTIPGLIDDSPSKIKGCRDFKHRHDQSIYSLLAWKYSFDVDLAKSVWESFGRPVKRKRPKGYVSFRG